MGHKRVLRLMREAGLLAPQRARGRGKPRPRDGTIFPREAYLAWLEGGGVIARATTPLRSAAKQDDIGRDAHLLPNHQPAVDPWVSW